MCVICSRRGFISGAISTLVIGPSHAAQRIKKIACGFNNDDFEKIRASMSSMPRGEAQFHGPLLGELKGILEVMPVDPGFQYVEASNAFAVPETYVGGTKGTVMIGVSLVRDLLRPDDGGISVAGVLAHECAHIFQYFSPYLERLDGPTPVLLELHADALAGYYLAKKVGPSARRLGVLQRELIQGGTYNDRDPTHHGTPGQRNAALDKGYMLQRNGLNFAAAAAEAEQFVQRLVQ